MVSAASVGVLGVKLGLILNAAVTARAVPGAMSTGAVRVPLSLFPCATRFAVPIACPLTEKVTVVAGAWPPPTLAGERLVSKVTGSLYWTVSPLEPGPLARRMTGSEDVGRALISA